MMRVAQYVALACVWAFVLALVAQTYLAGLAFFDGAAWIQAHTGLGWMLGMSSILVPVLVAAARFPKGVVLLALLQLALSIVQVGLVSWWQALRIPSLTALHPANALLLFVTSWALAMRATRWVRSTRTHPPRLAGAPA